jgi:ankyrin repeat protein
LLLRNGADANAKNEKGHVPLQVAARYGFKEIQEIIEKYEHKDKDGEV